MRHWGFERTLNTSRQISIGWKNVHACIIKLTTNWLGGNIKKRRASQNNTFLGENESARISVWSYWSQEEKLEAQKTESVKGGDIESTKRGPWTWWKTKNKAASRRRKRRKQILCMYFSYISFSENKKYLFMWQKLNYI